MERTSPPKRPRPLNVEGTQAPDNEAAMVGTRTGERRRWWEARVVCLMEVSLLENGLL
jgi:hypothetical protein